MAVSYVQVLSTDMIVSEIEAMLDWRNRIVRQCLFPAEKQTGADGPPPSTILGWARQEAERNTLDKAVSDRLFHVHEEMTRAARALKDHCAAGNPPTAELYDALDNQCDSFITHIRRLYQDMADSSTAVDPVTGLRTVSGMFNDIKREQDRFDRKGTSFSISCIEIDKMDQLQQSNDRRGMDVVYATVAQVIAKTVRSFDDAYFLGKGEFVLVLKHVDFLDACVVMDRLRGEIENTPVFLPSGERLTVTASFGVGEAIQGAKPETCVGNARAALAEAKSLGGNRVSEFREMSALGQLARDINKQGS